MQDGIKFSPIHLFYLRFHFRCVCLFSLRYITRILSRTPEPVFQDGWMRDANSTSLRCPAIQPTPPTRSPSYSPMAQGCGAPYTDHRHILNKTSQPNQPELPKPKSAPPSSIAKNVPAAALCSGSENPPWARRFSVSNDWCWAGLTEKVHPTPTQFQTRIPRVAPRSPAWPASLKLILQPHRQNQISCPLSLVPCTQLQFLFTPLSRFFSSFVHTTCLLSVFRPYLALWESYPTFSAQIPMSTTLQRRWILNQHSRLTQDFHLVSFPFPRKFQPQTRFLTAFAKLQLGSPRFQFWAFPSSLAVTDGIIVIFFSWS